MNHTSEPEQILASLEPDQLATAKQHFRRRILKGPEILLLWSLRLYLLFMLAVVLYQIWLGGR
jgi:hypothetical protein